MLPACLISHICTDSKVQLCTDCVHRTIWLMQEKHSAVFESDTDTEVIPKLLKYVFSKIDKLSHHQPTLPELVMEIMSQLEGAFALLIKSSHYPGELVAAKRG